MKNSNCTADPEIKESDEFSRSFYETPTVATNQLALITLGGTTGAADSGGPENTET